ncbi:MAG: Uma2 family endonuclease [Candidatus Competibacteraceae bacterium]|nr:Uma2 family endonuclease [Candidatus Competibacteraceae bacterium]HRY14926.1 Uma2 family endonuclease [Candidatus Competibacteraceae bacterium]
MTDVLAPVHRWTRQQYDDMVLNEIFRPGERVELIEGVIIDMSPQKSRHATAIYLVEERLREAFKSGHIVRAQMPLALDDHSEPEPDVAVVPGQARDYTQAHPTTAALVVEVSDATLRLDRQTKQAVYARNGVTEYWIVNLQDHHLEVYRDPQGDQYRSRIVLPPGEQVAPLARPDHLITVADLLP